MEKTEKFEAAFKAIVYFTHNGKGEPFTEKQIVNLEHRRFIPSFDTRRGKFKHNITDHRNAFNKLERQIRNQYYNKYTTAFIVANDYNGYTIVLRKYVYNICKFGLSVQFVDWQDGKGTNKYFIPDADNLIKMHKLNLLSDEQKKIIKPVDYNIPVALPYYSKSLPTLSDKIAHLKIKQGINQAVI